MTRAPTSPSSTTPLCKLKTMIQKWLLPIVLLCCAIQGQELCETSNLIGRCVNQPDDCEGLSVAPMFSPCTGMRACCLPGNCRYGAIGAGFCRTNDSQCAGSTVPAAQAMLSESFFFFFFFLSMQTNKKLTLFSLVDVKHLLHWQTHNKLFVVFLAERHRKC
jgi:hypothetical protein